MGLDFVVRDEEGNVLARAMLGVDTHWDIVCCAKDGGLQLLQRLKDYYEDAEYTVAELGELLSEIKSVARNYGLESATRVDLEGLGELTKIALEKGRPIHAIAD